MDVGLVRFRGTFRDAFSSWQAKTMLSSAKLHRICENGKLTRQLDNEAFAAFISTLKFPKEHNLNEVFSYTVCEKKLPSGEKRLPGVVKDRTAVGIQKKLPNFHRDNRLVLPVPRVAEHQYLMCPSKFRQSLELVFKICRNSSSDGMFEVALTSKKDDIVAKFFAETLPPGETSCRSHTFASLSDTSAGGRGIRIPRMVVQ